ncbi:MAG: PIN domain-containing protein [Acidobacteriia bacterium]|nr:PIN domain-containing protein [Terriglobia bacterium]MBV8905852.1 PIN domain-containing protein [Terriglobia bacterium]MBV9745348.1 PIN domain-containing protein [Terriglobia bacterium]
MSLVYWDTMVFVYWMEDHPSYGPRTRQIWEKMQERGDSLCTSVFTLGEVLMGFYRRSAPEATAVRDKFQPPNVALLPLSIEVAERYGQIRAAHRVSPADAIHLASASVARANLFLTNDAVISKLTIPGIDFVAGLGVNLF